MLNFCLFFEQFFKGVRKLLTKYRQLALFFYGTVFHVF